MQEIATISFQTEAASNTIGIEGNRGKVNGRLRGILNRCIALIDKKVSLPRGHEVTEKRIERKQAIGVWLLGAKAKRGAIQGLLKGCDILRVVGSRKYYPVIISSIEKSGATIMHMHPR